MIHQPSRPLQLRPQRKVELCLRSQQKSIPAFWMWKSPRPLQIESRLQLRSLQSSQSSWIWRPRRWKQGWPTSCGQFSKMNAPTWHKWQCSHLEALHLFGGRVGNCNETILPAVWMYSALPVRPLQVKTCLPLILTPKGYPLCTTSEIHTSEHRHLWEWSHPHIWSLKPARCQSACSAGTRTAPGQGQ